MAGDHWHTALDVNICGEWLDPAPAFEKPYDSPNQVANAGIHSHADGLIHTHPFVVSEEGNNATIGKFFDYGGWGCRRPRSTSAVRTAHTQWQGPASTPKTRRGAMATCARSASTRARRSSSPGPVDGKKKTGNPADYKQKDGETLAIYMLPKGADMPFPPAACTSFAEISDASSAILSKNSPCRTETPTTTAPVTTAPTPSTP